MANLNEINKKITDITNALQNLSDEQMNSIERSVFGYLDIQKLIQKKEAEEQKYYSTRDTVKLLLSKAEEKTFRNKLALLSSYDSFFSNGQKKLLTASKAIDKLGKAKYELNTKVTPKKDITKDDTNALS